MGKLDGKVVVVTGASRGIGADIARLFAAEGGRVVCAARTLREGDHPLAGSLEHTVGEIRGAGNEATAVAADISEPAECERLMQAARAAYGPVDVLVNNAALTYFIEVKEYPVNKWIRSWAVNVHAPFVLAKLALEDMIPRRSGSIVNISSGSAIGPGRGPYPRARALFGRHLLRGGEGRARAVHPGAGPRGVPHGVSVTALSPSQVVPTPGTVHHKLVRSMDDPRGEPPILMARAALLLATEPCERITGRVTYSQQILKEHGWIDAARGRGVDTKGSGYSQI